MQLDISLYSFSAYNDDHVRIFYLYFDFTWPDRSEREKKQAKERGYKLRNYGSPK